MNRAASLYAGPALHFAVGHAGSLPVDSASQDRLLLLHDPASLAELPELLGEAQRVLRLDGLLLVALAGVGAERAATLCAERFPAVATLHQRFFTSSVIEGIDPADRLDQNRDDGVMAPVTLILAGAALPAGWAPASDLSDATDPALDHARREIALAQAEIAYLRRKLSSLAT